MNDEQLNDIDKYSVKQKRYDAELRKEAAGCLRTIRVLVNFFFILFLLVFLIFMLAMCRLIKKSYKPESTIEEVEEVVDNIVF